MKKLRKLFVLTGLSALVLSCGNTQAASTAAAKSNPAVNTQVLGQVAMKNWFGMNAEQLRRQVRGTKDVYMINASGKSLSGLEKDEDWFGETVRTVYHLDGENTTLSSIELYYPDGNYNTIISNMTKQLGTPISNKVTEKNMPSVQEAEFSRNGLHFTVTDFSGYISVIIIPE
ncbi:hypothetical protein [Sebaldella sp. S0638]|uniref:hypothetical protein n=1 Tax=Sebaldella sp. S0638 TaxID=2957809 RepID=UPI0020A0161D|nr:hypothetical protein [Sebaldella sp. S0638]MCP1224040.1 hypothetical protein [Sebaldella sp. S0638]